MPAHQRKCHDCGNVAEHADNVVPAVLCNVCAHQRYLSLTDAELVAAIIARNRRDNGKTFTLGGNGQAIVDQMEWESLHSRVLLAETKVAQLEAKCRQQQAEIMELRTEVERSRVC